VKEKKMQTKKEERELEQANEKNEEGGRGDEPTELRGRV
jgi:hypothetical protein